MVETNRTSKASKQINSAAFNSRRGRQGRGCWLYSFLNFRAQKCESICKICTFLLSHFGARKLKKECSQQPLPPLPRLLLRYAHKILNSFVSILFCGYRSIWVKTLQQVVSSNPGWDLWTTPGYGYCRGLGAETAKLDLSLVQGFYVCSAIQSSLATKDQTKKPKPKCVTGKSTEQYRK